MEQMKAIMTSLRTDTPKEIAGVAVTSFSDYLASETTDLQTGEKTAIELPEIRRALFCPCKRQQHCSASVRHRTENQGILYRYFRQQRGRTCGD